jgi:hypothetical protein
MRLLFEKRRVLKTVAAIVVALIATTAHAGLIVDVLDTNLTAGGTGTMNVMIRSEFGTEVLSSYGIVLQITKLSGASGDQLQFVNPQSNSQGGSSNYVLFGDSLGISSTVVPVNWPNDNYFGTDTTISNGVGVPTTELLLARLEFNTSLTANGDRFLVSLDSINSSYTDEAFKNTFSFSGLSHNGIATIGVVPEPSSLTLAAFGIAAAAWFRFHQKSRTRKMR